MVHFFRRVLNGHRDTIYAKQYNTRLNYKYTMFENLDHEKSAVMLSHPDPSDLRIPSNFQVYHDELQSYMNLASKTLYMSDCQMGKMEQSRRAKFSAHWT